jgi:hypothetical protein
MSSEAGKEWFFCGLRPMPRILSLRSDEGERQSPIDGRARVSLNGNFREGLCTRTFRAPVRRVADLRPDFL